MKNENKVIDDKVFEDDISPEFLSFEEVEKRKKEIDHSKAYILPTLKMRYISMLIDVAFLVLLSICFSYVANKIGDVPDYIRGLFLGFVLLIYEPLFVSLGATLGQILVGIRVRRFINPERKLFFPLVIIRFIVKVLLGWISLLTVTANINRRAMHDIASGSIMIHKKSIS